MTYNLLEKFRPDDIVKLELSRASSGLSFYIEYNDKFVEVPCLTVWVTRWCVLQVLKTWI